MTATETPTAIPTTFTEFCTAGLFGTGFERAAIPSTLLPATAALTVL